MKRDIVTFNGKQYPIRTFLVIEDDGAETQRTIATESLSNAMGEEKEVWDTEANDLDCQIYYYVSDKVINFLPEEICENHLDIPMKFVEEIFGYIE